MSFGWSAGDIFAAVKLLIDISQALSSAHGSPKDRARALSFVNPIKNGLEQLLIYAKEEEEVILSSDDTKVSAFRPTVQALEPLIKKFTEKVLVLWAAGRRHEEKRLAWETIRQAQMALCGEGGPVAIEADH